MHKYIIFKYYRLQKTLTGDLTVNGPGSGCLGCPGYCPIMPPSGLMPLGLRKGGLNPASAKAC